MGKPNPISSIPQLVECVARTAVRTRKPGKLRKAYFRLTDAVRVAEAMREYGHLTEDEYWDIQGWASYACERNGWQKLG